MFKFRWRTFSKIWFQFPFKLNLDESLVNRGFIVSSCQALLSSLWLKFNSILAGHFLTKQSYKFLLLLLLLLFVFRIPFPKRPSSPQSQPSLGWSSLRTSSTGTLRLLSWQTGSHTGFCQSRELLRPSLCSHRLVETRTEMEKRLPQWTGWHTREPLTGECRVKWTCQSGGLGRAVGQCRYPRWVQFILFSSSFAVCFN